MDHGLYACQIFTTLDKDQYIKFGYGKVSFHANVMLQMESFYFSIDLSEALKCVAFHNHSGEDEISNDYLK